MISYNVYFIPILGIFVYTVGLCVYRLVFHPLAKFPGPKLAVVTKWYEFYFDVLKPPGGTFMFEIERMHRVYGPIVRINPDEIHVKDSLWFHTLYAGPTQGIRDKYAPAAHMTGTPQGVFGTVSHETHRKRRAALSHFFSKSVINSAESMINDKTRLLLSRVQQQLSQDGYAEMRVNYLAMTTDTVCSHALDESMNLLGNENRAKDWYLTIRAIAILTPLVKQYRWIIPLALRVPLVLLGIVVPALSRIAALRKDMDMQAEIAIEKQKFPPLLDGPGLQKRATRLNLFESILEQQNLPLEEKQKKRIAQEGFVVIAAGGETTARVLTTATYFLLANKNTFLARMNDEIAAVAPDPAANVSLKTLEQLPWLTAIIKESLRITALVTSRLPLVSPNETLTYRDLSIPPGTPVSMTLRDVLLDPEIFEGPMDFRPQRWLTENPDLDRISQAYLPFGRGSRMCLGLNLALAEIYIVLGHLFRRFDLSLHDTVRERDIDVVRDAFIGEVSWKSKGVKVKLAEPSKQS